MDKSRSSRCRRNVNANWATWKRSGRLRSRRDIYGRDRSWRRQRRCASCVRQMAPVKSCAAPSCTVQRFIIGRALTFPQHQKVPPSFHFQITRLMPHNTGQLGWASNRKSIHSLTPYLCHYYSVSLITFLHLLPQLSPLTRTTQPCIPPGSLNRVPALIGWGKLGNVTSARWQVTLCDPIWHVSFLSGACL